MKTLRLLSIPLASAVFAFSGSFWHPAHAADSCTDLKPGETRNTEGYIGTPVWGHYVLARTQDRTLTRNFEAYRGQVVLSGTVVPAYQALVNIRFLDANGNYDEKLARKFEKKTQGCYDRAESKLRGPDGEFLSIALSTLHPEIDAPRASDIKITRKWFFRSNSGNWKYRPNCPLILHETLHLLGLVDEYQETDRVHGKLEYDCRALGPRRSVMNEQDIAWFFTAMTKDSLLRAGQFRAIIWPGCLARNAVYYECARDAYSTSAGHGGGGCTPDKPPVCKKRSWVDF